MLLHIQAILDHKDKFIFGFPVFVVGLFCKQKQKKKSRNHNLWRRVDDKRNLAVMNFYDLDILFFNLCTAL